MPKWGTKMNKRWKSCANRREKLSLFTLGIKKREEQSRSKAKHVVEIKEAFGQVLTRF